MKIVINADNNDFINDFISFAQTKEHNVIAAKTENSVFENIENSDINAFILSSSNSYVKKAIDFIKKSNPYTPVIILLSDDTIKKSLLGDIFIPVTQYNDIIIECIILNLEKYVKNFATLQRLTAKIHDKIEFANCVYDPTRRILSYRGNEIKKFSIKEGGILEILAINFGEVVKKEVILEKVWRKTDYFAGRSMDVYITYLRNTLKNNNVKLSIINISGIGLTLELER